LRRSRARGTAPAAWVFPKQVVAATPWLRELSVGIDLLADKPVLIVWGMKDLAFREHELVRREAAFPETRSIHVPTVGHYVQEEAPERLGEAIADLLGGADAARA